MHDDDSREWDERYEGEADGAPIWSGRANATMVAEVADLAPGSVLDVGCGEGADAIWLAQHGWRVTAIDPSAVALARARAAAEAAGTSVTWIHAGLLDMPGGTGSYDLVSAQYPALRHDDGHAAIATLLDAVAPGGTLLFVHHAVDHHHADHGYDPADYVSPADIVTALDDRFELELDETRPRPGPLPPETEHIADIVVRARRLGDNES